MGKTEAILELAEETMGLGKAAALVGASLIDLIPRTLGGGQP